MPEKGDRKKPMYEPPVVVPLGELAKGSGTCGTGSAPADDGFVTCTVGGVAGTCTTGGVGAP